MSLLSCFVYKEGRDFVLPARLASMTPVLCNFAVSDGAGGIHPHPEIFRETAHPDDAQVFLFPLAIGQYIDSGQYEAISGVISGLPYLPGREERHIVFDDGDWLRPLPQPVCLFKCSTVRKFADRVVPYCHSLPAHVLADRADFCFERIGYDCSFVGRYSNQIRKAAVLSIQRDAPELRFFVEAKDDVIIAGGAFFTPQDQLAYPEQERLRFRRSIKNSFTVLCLPGVGVQSLRMYETMYFGRIPVIVGGDIVYPLADEVRYAEFCLILEPDDVVHVGPMLQAWLARHTREQLQKKCTLACKQWHHYFGPKYRTVMLAEARKKFEF